MDTLGGNQQHTVEEDKENTEEVVVLEEEDISEGLHACLKNLNGRIFADRTFSTGTMEGAMTAIWNRPEGLRVVDKGKNQFQFFFYKDTDVARVERGFPWLFKNFILHVVRWKEDPMEGKNAISTFPIWVQIWGLPEQFKTIEVGRKLGMKIGSIGDVGLYEVRGKETRIIKANVEIEGDRRLRDSMKITGPNQKLIEVGLRYERLGTFCTYCALLGHDSKHCQQLVDDSASDGIREKAIGEWVKADQVGRRIESKSNSNSSYARAPGSSTPKPRKKPAPSWLLENFADFKYKRG
ncbi:uncharacterized protein LOC130934922 [Arachis stenosperma]|uniref:uncharacterized protein LOC130934922 n=1 Tax=Arachis stenosperma TaxID=217475 RepID=UPI0025ACAC68|nr:uncharacterized protein LOC130934922 [Arachis stenosperma]